MNEQRYDSADVQLPEGQMGKCIYCGECMPCDQGIDIPKVNKLYDLATSEEESFDSVWEQYRAMEVNADDCVACGECERVCPHGVPVATRMAAICELFDEEMIEDEEGFFAEDEAAFREAEADAFFKSLYESSDEGEYYNQFDEDDCDCGHDEHCDCSHDHHGECEER